MASLYKKIFDLAGWEFVGMRVEIVVNETPEPTLYGRKLMGKIQDVVNEIQTIGPNGSEWRIGNLPVVQLNSTLEHIGMKTDWLISVPIGNDNSDLYRACFFSTWFNHIPLVGPGQPKEVRWENVIGRWPMKLRR
jgi:hypothetical protein